MSSTVQSPSDIELDLLFQRSIDAFAGPYGCDWTAGSRALWTLRQCSRWSIRKRRNEGENSPEPVRPMPSSGLGRSRARFSLACMRNALAPTPGATIRCIEMFSRKPRPSRSPRIFSGRGGGQDDQAAVRAEQKHLLQEAPNAMDSMDREVRRLRHCEQLSNDEAAAVLNIAISVASESILRPQVNLRDPRVAAGFQEQEVGWQSKV